VPVTHFSKVFAVKDAKIAVMSTDIAGSAPTYGTSYDVPGIKSVEVSGDIETKYLRGDNGPLDADAVLGNVAVKFENAKIHLDILAAILGGTVTDAGTTPNQTATWDLTQTSKPVPFKLSAVSASADPIAGNISMIWWKCILSKFPDMGLAEEDYKTIAAEAACSPTLGTGLKIMSTAINETAVVLT
jgi:hypothetical protein